MNSFPIFLSVIYIVRNLEPEIHDILQNASTQLMSQVRDHEIIIIDNASSDNSIALLKELSGKNGIPNLQIYALTREVDKDIATIVGIENAIGDFVLIIDPMTDDISSLKQMLFNIKIGGGDVIYARNKENIIPSFSYRIANNIFNKIFYLLNGVHLPSYAIGSQLLSRAVVSFILQHSNPEIAYRYLPVTGGFSQINIDYSTKPIIKDKVKKQLSTSVKRGIRIITSTTQAPIRIATLLSLFGAIINITYSLYVVVIALIKDHITEGWISLSLQNSGMFFIFSIVMFVIGEYILHIASFGERKPSYHIAQEFASVMITHKEKLNIEVASSIAD